MGLGKKLASAIASSFIEVRLGPDAQVQAPPDLPLYFVADPVPAPESAPAPALDLTSALRPDGELDEAVVYAGATFTPVSFTAEQAMHVLEELPTSASAAPLRCATMHQALAVLGDDPSSTAHQVVSDAAQKMVALNQYMAQRRAEVKVLRRDLVEEMDELQDRLNALHTLLENTNASYRQLEDAGRARVDDLTGLIAFFDEFQAYLCARQERQERAEPPAYPSAFQVLRSSARDDG